MTFYYEQLDPERFQQFCQALIVNEYPGTQCFPVGQRDGGRDAVQVDTSASMQIRVFQVKFVRNPSSITDKHKWLEGVLDEEGPKVLELISQGYEISEYILVTNVGGTAYLNAGTIDKASAYLSEELPVPAQMWWREDLDRRCEAAPAIQWSYPDILRGTDVLVSLAHSFPEAYNGYRYEALRKFIVIQHEEDSEVRFQQVELTNDLLQLFIDVPATIQLKRDGRRQVALRQAMRNVRERAESDGVTRKGTPHLSPRFIAPVSEDEESVGAAALLLDGEIAKQASCVVLEGGPGQGKSTLGQYICQVHRMTVLNDYKIANVPEAYRPSSVRLPVKVDLREYATWLSGRNPFAVDRNEKRPHGSNKSLEAFIAALISDRSGGLAFDTNDLSAIAQKSALIVVLDGLDEVADVALRNEVVKEISAATRRLRDSAASLQVVVTTRPSALAEVSNFPTRLFDSWTLARLTRPLIIEYAGRWATCNRLKPKAKGELRRVLQDKLDHAHMRELARNPMQLTILLSLIHTRGSSLPDKRTTLYDLYVDLFFARESGKNEIVKEFRDDLIDLHRYLAWVLHTEAETGATLGKIDAERLLEILREYLDKEGRDPELANKLFHGVTQRVVFLVGAVEGQYQFEVQPLREYFAGRFLYEDAPYSSPGNPRAGTIDERFDAAARNIYWQNVTRFYAGCFSKGELPALVDRLQVLCAEGDLSLTAYPRALAATLVSDWVFNQNARSLKSVIELILAGDGYRSLIGPNSIQVSRDESLVLPEGCGRVELLNRCFEVLAKTRQTDVRLRVARLAQANSTPEELKQRWLEHAKANPEGDLNSWMSVGYFLGSLSKCGDEEVKDLIPSTRQVDGELISILCHSGHFKFLDLDDGRRSAFIQEMLDGRVMAIPTNTKHDLAVLYLFVGLFAHGIFVREILTRANRSRLSLKDMIRRFVGTKIVDPAPTQDKHYSQVTAAFLSLAERPVEDWLTSDELWKELMGSLIAVAGERWRIFAIGLNALRWDRQWPGSPIESDLWDPNVHLLDRLRSAYRHKGNAAWWERQLDMASNEQELQLTVYAAFHICGPITLAKFSSAADRVIRALSEHDAVRLYQHLNESVQVRPRRNSNILSRLPNYLHERTAAMLGVKMPQSVQAQLISSYLQSYAGSDPVVLEFALNSLSSAGQTSDVKDWNEILRLAKLAYAQDIEPYTYSMHIRRETMPVEVARRVAGDRTSYPCAMVDLAERSCLRSLGERTVPLAFVAENQGWFAE
jgi:hypothetical protein